MGVSYGGHGIPIAFMVSTNEDTNAYLTFLTSVFDSEFHPDVVVVDKSDAEINAINIFRTRLKTASPTPMVCFFHVMHAVHRHMRSSGIDPETAQVVMSILRAVHTEESKEMCDALIEKMIKYINKKG
jgi:hypothetical protein